MTGWSLVAGWDKTGGSRSELTNGNKPPPSKMWVHSMASHLFTIKHHGQSGHRPGLTGFTEICLMISVADIILCDIISKLSSLTLV